MGLKEKYPNVFKSLELWSEETKPNYQKRFIAGKLSSVEYIAIMNKLCFSNRHQVDKWLSEDVVTFKMAVSD